VRHGAGFAVKVAGKVEKVGFKQQVSAPSVFHRGTASEARNAIMNDAIGTPEPDSIDTEA
jgi:hypothetical protein